jgi:hypothetical protein
MEERYTVFYARTEFLSSTVDGRLSVITGEAGAWIVEEHG